MATNSWEQRKFSSLYKKVTEKNDLSFNTKNIISVANMYLKTDAIVGSDQYLSTYNIMRLGDIAFEGNKSKDFAHGRFVENYIGDGIVSHVFNVFRPISAFDLSFRKYQINNEMIMGPKLLRCTKSSTMMTDLVPGDFLDEYLSVPSLEEQRLVGSFLDRISCLITLHQRKLEKIKCLKKALLEKMFPGNGEEKPRIRFKGFVDPWEQRK
ncbi:MAG: restriction endonuclease subunit S, partial [Bacilli bacterium]|nr:restriction endonuclease subunit S [Bacilli bacterium]